MKKCIVIVIFTLTAISCSSDHNSQLDVYDLIPNDSDIIIKVNELTDYNSILEDNLTFSSFKTKVSYVSNILNQLNLSEILLIAIDSSDEDLNVSFITKHHNSLIRKDSTLNIITEQIEDNSIYKSVINNKDTLYHRVIDSLFFGSSNLTYVKNADATMNQQIIDLIKTSDNTKTVSYIYKEQSQLKNAWFLGNNVNLNTANSILDFTFRKNSIQYNGVATSSDTLHILNSFKNTIPQEFKLAKIIPAQVSSVKRIAYDDYLLFSSNLSEIKQIHKDSIPNVLNFSTEIAEIEIKQQYAIILHGLDSNLISEALISEPSIEVYKSISIFSYNNPDFFSNKLSPFVSTRQVNYFFILDNFVAFSNSIETLQTIITSKLNDNTLSTSDYFNSITPVLADESSYFIYKNENGLNAIFSDSKKGYNANAFQLVYDNHFAHVNGVFKSYKKRKATNAVTEYFSTTLPSELIIAPQTLKNHITNAQDIIVQDVNNILYLISNNGKVLWKKELQSKILGKVEQIDIYKNGRLQLVFATANRVYIIDRNGNDVGPFPLKFNDKITQPLSVFDYDNNKNYRLLVTQGKNLLMYGSRGKRISGFTYKIAENTILTQPKHFRIGSKDYIVFAQDSKLEILNRQGKTRVNVRGDISFSGNPIFLYQNKFTTTNTSGQLVQIDTRGNINLKALNVDNTHTIETTSKTLVSLSNNKLNIKTRTVDLEYGDYTPPKIFYLNDKIYISTTDLQAKKVYLFDSQAKLIPNFPVYGTSEATLKNIDRNRGLELITQSDAKTVVVYKLN